MQEIKQMSLSGLRFLMDNEGLRLSPYLDSKGIPTIGVGCTYYPNGQKVTMQDEPITEQRAMDLFRHVLQHYELTVYSNTRDDLNQNEFDSLVSLCYNIGVQAFKGSTLVRKINERADYPVVKGAFLMWKKPTEIIPRRLREVELFFKPV